MEQLTKNQAVATSQEAVQNQNEPQLRDENAHNDKSVHGVRSEERFSRNAETDLVCRLLPEKKSSRWWWSRRRPGGHGPGSGPESPTGGRWREDPRPTAAGK